jgi:hypothetical protein
MGLIKVDSVERAKRASINVDVTRRGALSDEPLAA